MFQGWLIFTTGQTGLKVLASLVPVFQASLRVPVVIKHDNVRVQPAIPKRRFWLLKEGENRLWGVVYVCPGAAFVGSGDTLGAITGELGTPDTELGARPEPEEKHFLLSSCINI